VTGSGEDSIRTGQGASWVDSGGAHDEVTTLDRPDLAADPTSAPRARVAGGGGDDAVTVGNAVDTVMGDGSLRFTNHGAAITVKAANDDDVSLSDMLDPAQVAVPSDPSATAGNDGHDQVSAGLGGSTLFGNNGDDKIGTANDNPQAELAGIKGTADEAKYRARSNEIVGGGGNDKIKSGSASDTIYTGARDDSAKNDVGPNNTGSGDAASDENSVDTGTGSDTVYGSNGKDFVTTHSTPSQTAKAYGGGADDVLIGALGTDELFGGPGDDYLVAGPATVSGDFPVVDDLGSARRVTLEPITPPVSEKLLVGGGGSDRIYGVDGPATIYGDHEKDDCERQSDPVSKEPDENPTTGGPAADNDAADLVLGGAGVDTVQAGGGDDHVYLDAADDVACGNAGADRMFGGADDDLVYGGSGMDTLYGDSGEDELYANTGEDTGYGGSQDDRIQGNEASDVLFGGTGADTVVGGTSKAGTADEGDRLYGDAGDDVLIGDNGKPDPTPTYPDDLSNTDAAPIIGGEDDVFGGDGEDRVYGGLEGDRVHGGGDADHEEGNNGEDRVWGDEGADNISGGSSESASAGTGRPDTGDLLWGGGADDVITGDNAVLANVGAGLGSVLTRGRRMTSERSIVLLDLGDSPAAGTSGKDVVHGDAGTDVILGQGAPDRIFGDDASDYAEGGPAADWVEGGDGSDDLVGGSSTVKSGSGEAAQGQPDAGDVLWGQAGDDVATGDNAVVTRVAPFNDLTFRIGGDGAIEERRSIRLLDLDNGGLLNAPDAIRFGADQLSGQAGVDVLLGQDGADALSGGSADDYAEGQGAGDTVFGDDQLADHAITPVPPAAGWPGSPSPTYDADGLAPGQDDLIGGSSRPGFRDAGDQVHGNGASDFVLGDNGTAVRDVQSDGETVTPDDPTPTGVLTDRLYTRRYGSPTPAGAAKVRHHDPDQAEPTTRFCTVAQATCEVSGAFGGDDLFGEGGDDFLYGQDGNDRAYGGTEDDDIYGELGADQLWGDDGDDAILGDRGGVRDDFQDGSQSFDLAVTQVPKVEFRGFPSGSVVRTTDLLHDVDGDAFVGTSGSAAMPHPGLNEGGDDRIRGGTGHDSVHAGFGDDLANGDSGGDWVFGDDGSDVLWGGKGCDQSVDTPASAPYCYPGGVFDPAPHNSAGETIPLVTDYVLGGKGGTSQSSLQGVNGSDILDWRPRGTYVAGTGCTANQWPVDLATGGKKGTITTVDPCTWFEMTDIHDADVNNNQHHQGVDWQYGGWDRDVLQGDVADNGPNEGDRLLDWNGAYNLYTHCNSAYGGYNDIRQHSPTWQSFLQQWAYALGAGQEQVDASAAGRSAFVELALVFPGADNAHGSGSAFPSTPGHFDNPNACAL
jgi:Ca2+-binding RTX toxin-like protein